MPFFKKKKEKKFIRGGFRQYRKPSDFGSSQKIVPKQVEKPTITFAQIKKIFFALVVISLLWLFFFSPVFAIKDVFVEGNNLVPKETVSVYAPVGHNILRYKIGQTKNNILHDHPEIKAVEIYKGLPNAVKMVVLEEDSKIVWQTSNKRYLISSQGKAAKEISVDEFKELPLVVDKKGIAVTPGEKLVSPSFITFVLNMSNQFFDKTNIKINHFEVEETTFDVSAYTEAGFYVKMNTMRSSAKQLENLKLLLVSKRQDIHEYVDLRIDGWGYFK